MNLLSIRIIAANFDELVEFYGQITGQIVAKYTPNFAELKTPALSIAIFVHHDK